MFVEPIPLKLSIKKLKTLACFTGYLLNITYNLGLVNHILLIYENLDPL